MSESNLRKTGFWLLKPCTRKLIGFLSHQELQLRNDAAKALGEIGDEEAILPLIDCLFREKQDEQISLALASFKSLDALDALLQYFNDANNETKPNIATALGSYRDKRVIAALIEGLNHIDPNVRFNCITSLGKLKSMEAVPHLLASIGEANEWIFLNVVNSLARIGDHRATQTLTTFYSRERNERKRAVIVAALGSLNDLTSIPALTRALRDTDDRVKANAIESLSLLSIPQEKITSLIQPFLKHPNNRVRGNAIIAADKLGSIDLTSVLQEMKHSPDRHIRATLAYTLRKIEHEKALSLCIELLHDADKLVRENAAIALASIAREAQSEVIIKLLNDENDEVKQQGVLIIGKLRIKTAAEWLSKLYTSTKNSTLRSAIVTSLGAVGSKFEVPTLEEALHDQNSRVRANAIESLETLLGEKAISIIKPMLKDSDNRVRANATNSLFKLGGIEVLNNLEKMLSSSDLSTKLSAIYTMGQLGKTIEELERLPFETPLKKKLEAIDLPNLEYIQQTFDNLPKHYNQPAISTSEELAKAIITDKAMPASSRETERNIIIQLANEAQHTQAYALSAKYLKKYPDDLMMQFYAGNTAYKLEKYTEAAVHFKKVTELDFFHVQAFSNLGMSLFKAGKPIEATESLKSALKLKPEYTTIRYNLANIYLKLRKYHEAAKNFEEGLKYEQPTSKILNNLAFAYSKLGDYNKSAEVYRRVLAIDSKDTGAYYNLAVTLIILNKKQDAIQLLVRAKSMMNANGAGLKNIQELLEQLKNANK